MIVFASFGAILGLIAYLGARYSTALQQLLGILVAVVLAFIIVTPRLPGQSNRLESEFPLVALSAIFGLGAGIGLVTLDQFLIGTIVGIGSFCLFFGYYLTLLVRRHSTVEREDQNAFDHLTIHFPSKEASPKNPVRPYFVSNSNSNRAYWVPDVILASAREDKIQWITHEGEKAMNAYFRRARITPIETFPKKDELD